MPGRTELEHFDPRETHCSADRGGRPVHGKHGFDGNRDCAPCDCRATSTPTPLTLKLAVTSYLLSLAVFIPVSGWTADRFGARTVFRGAIAVFMLGSIGCAISASLSQFAWRGLCRAWAVR